MRGHKKTKESGFFEGNSSDTDGPSVNMGKALKRTKISDTSSESRRRVEYTQDELDTHIRKSDSQGMYLQLLFLLNSRSFNSILTFLLYFPFNRKCMLFSWNLLYSFPET